MEALNNYYFVWCEQIIGFGYDSYMMRDVNTYELAVKTCI